MSKITIDKSKVIIDGHASDLDTCNTLTNLCDELNNSDKFKTVRYENGYGEFESVRENEEKKFAGDPGTVQLYIKSNDGNTVLFSDIYSGGYVESTENGFSYRAGGQIVTYEYSGSKVFSGLANAPNSNVAKYPVGTGWMFSEYDGATDVTLYIVENIVLPESYSTLTALFSDIATVIREKTGDTASIIADDFPDVIRSSLQVISPPAYLTFSSPSVFTLKVNDTTKHWNGTLEYSTDTVTWSTWDGTTILYSALTPSKNVLYLRGTGNTKITGNISNYKWVLTGSDISCIGNIENLLDYATVQSGVHPTMASYCYASMFSNCTSLTQAPALPATKLAESCYQNMFYGCTSLTQAPSELPATMLAVGCYQYMFYNCTSLTQAPALPATTLANYCYYNMFSNCTSLTQAPSELPATTLANNCYQNMFYKCTSLTQAPTLPATMLAEGCYEGMFNRCTSLTQAPSELPATTLADYCYNQMFSNCTSLTQAPALPATKLAVYCCSNMFSNCTSLTQAPALPATKLEINCYQSMFYKCTSLTQAPSELPATTLANNCYRFMFEFTAITVIPRIMATTYATDSCKGMFDDVKTLNVYSSSGTGHTYGWTAPASTYCSGMFGSDDGESEWAKLDGSNFPNGGTPTEGVTYYFATVN